MNYQGQECHGYFGILFLQRKKSCAVYVLNYQNTKQQPKKQELGEQV